MGERVLLIKGPPDLAPGHLWLSLEHAQALGVRACGQALAAPCRRLRARFSAVAQLGGLGAWQFAAWLAAGLGRHSVGIAHRNFLPLWLGDMPTIPKGFLEQVTRSGFAFSAEGKNIGGRRSPVSPSSPVGDTLIGMAGNQKPRVAERAGSTGCRRWGRGAV